MEKNIKRCLRKGILAIFVAVAALLLSGPPLHAQSAVSVLLERARTQEQSGHIDLAAQTWQQVLLSDPNNTEAIAGLARWAKLAGRDAEANKYLERLRQINPADSNISRVQGMTSSKQQNAQLQEAARLAQSGNPEGALKIYRQVWGTHPPDGDWALAYYNTEASTDTGREDAINGLRALAKKYPNEPRYAINLGRILTYKTPTRAEGMRILREYPQDAGAIAALRQALVWDSQNPNAAPAIREYLKQHKDEALAQSLSEAQARQAQGNKGMAQSAAERAAYDALSANRVDDAQSRFLAIIATQPNNGRALAGLGFVRMKQGNFAEAVTYLEKAQQSGTRDKNVDQALTTSRFWYAVQQGTAALNDNHLDEAEIQYKAALTLRPNAPEALEGLSGAYMKAGQPSQAVAVYQQIVKLHPDSSEGWRGLFNAQVQAGQPAAAIATAQRFPAAVRTELNRDPEYLRNLAAAYTANGDSDSAQKVLAQALTLPFPDNGRNMKAETRLQYAALLAADKHYAQAAGLYRDIISDDPSNVSAWQGLIAVQHQAGHDADAVATVERMPPSTYDNALQDTGFLSMLAAIYQEQNHSDVAQGFLQQAVKVETEKGQPVSVALQLQLAATYLQQNNPQQAYAIYRSLLMQYPDRLDAWKGLLSALHQTGHDQDALAQMQQVPADVRRSLDQDVEYQQTVAAIYAATGNQQAALQMLSRIQAHYRAKNLPMPPDVAIQSAWLLYNAGDDRGLYRTLMALGGRTDLTDDQRRTVQTIWTSWSVRRAGQAADAGNTRRALQILNAAAQAFPGNVNVSKALASGYLKAGDPKQAMAIYTSLDMSNATPADYQGMVGSALALPNLKQAEIWLRQALEAYPSDPQVLALAARFEQARGDNSRAADYWRASLQAMPPVSPANQLAHTLNQPDAPALKPRQNAALAALLNPDADGDSTQTAPRPALPSYQNTYTASVSANGGVLGPDPYNVGTAPVPLSGNNLPEASPAPAPADATSHTTTTTTTTTTYAQPPQRTSPRTSTRPVPSASPTPAPPTPSVAPSTPPAQPTTTTHHRTSMPGSSYTTTHTVTTNSDGSSTDNSSPTSQRLGDYTPQSSLTAPPLPTGPTLSTHPPQQKADAFAPPSLPYARNGDLTGSSSSQDAGGVMAAANPDQGMLDSAQLHLVISSGSSGNSSADTAPLPSTPRPAPQQQPVQLTLDESPAIRYVPNSMPSIEAYNRSANTLAAAAKPIASAELQTQYASNPQQIASQSPQQIALLTPQQAPLQSYESSPATPYVPQAATPPATQPQEVQQQQTAPPPPGWRETKQTVTTTTTTTTALPQAPGATDEQLAQMNLPPLRGPANPHPIIRQRNPREEAEMQLATIEGGYSPWAGGTGYVNHRTGTPGLDQLTILESPFEGSTPLGASARVTVLATSSFLDSGVLTSTTTNRLGTLPAGATPSQQNAAGVSPELQISASNFGASVGSTPFGFVVTNITGRANWRPGAGPFTFTFNRDPIKDSQLSYSGLRDPGSASATYAGNVWGGVITTAGGVQYGKGDANSGYYAGFGGQYITGHHVETNHRIDGVAGAYWRAWNVPDTGNLTLGANFFAMHYATNLRYFTYGQGGYFSPQAYFLTNLPVTWNGHYGVNLHYALTGAFGIQAFQEDSSPFFPLDPAIQAANNNPGYPTQSNVGGNYDFHGEMSYHLTDHWYIGGFVGFNNTRDYANQVVGFFVRFLGRPQYPSELGPTGLFPYQGIRPLMVP